MAVIRDVIIGGGSSKTPQKTAPKATSVVNAITYKPRNNIPENVVLPPRIIPRRNIPEKVELGPVAVDPTPEWYKRQLASRSYNIRDFVPYQENQNPFDLQRNAYYAVPTVANNTWTNKKWADAYKQLQKAQGVGMTETGIKAYSDRLTATAEDWLDKLKTKNPVDNTNSDDVIYNYIYPDDWGWGGGGGGDWDNYGSYTNALKAWYNRLMNWRI